MRSKALLPLALFSAVFVLADEPALSPAAKVFDQQLTGVEREVVSLAEAMPAEKYNFAPTQGAFTKVRTFAQQVTHIATVNYMLGAALLGEANPVSPGESENGSADLKSKDEIVAYLKKSFAYTHTAMRTVTQANLMDQIQNAFGKNKTSRLSMATIPGSHSFDHYGQMVVYARMNGIVPPASR